MAPLVKYAVERDTGSPKPPCFQLRRLGAAETIERAVGASAAMDGESGALDMDE